MIDGKWWLVILLTVIAGLWLVAKARGNSSDKKESSYARGNIANSAKNNQTKPLANDNLQKTLALIKQHFPDYRATRKGNHLMLTKHNKKIAVITIDKSIAVGQRRLGDVPVINYHRVPSRAQLNISLQDAS